MTATFTVPVSINTWSKVGARAGIVWARVRVGARSVAWLFGCYAFGFATMIRRGNDGWTIEVVIS